MPSSFKILELLTKLPLRKLNMLLKVTLFILLLVTGKTLPSRAGLPKVWSVDHLNQLPGTCVQMETPGQGVGEGVELGFFFFFF